VGIGATTSVYSIIDGALLKLRPYRQPEELVFLTAEKLAGGLSNASISGKQFDEWEKQTKSLAGLAVYDWTFNFLVHPDGNESMEGMLGSSALFNVLGVQPILGRTFTPAERTARDHPVVILGHELWQRRFAADPNVIGKVISISRLPPLTVIGVMPPDMRFLPSRGGAQEPNYNLHAHVDYWLPSAVDVESRSRRWNVVARLKPGVSLPQARAELATIAATQAQSEAELNGITIAVTPIGDVLDGELRRIVLPLFGARAWRRRPPVRLFARRRSLHACGDQSSAGPTALHPDRGRRPGRRGAGCLRGGGRVAGYVRHLRGGPWAHPSAL
jgi:hypothetical protein